MAIEKSEDETKKSDGVENTSEETKSTDDTITMSKSDLADLIDTKIKEAASTGGSKELVEAFAEVLNKDKKYEKYDELSYLTPANIDIDDLLDSPVIFWASGWNYIIGDDRRNGLPTPPPYKIIHFKPEGSKQTQSGKDINTMIWSKYESSSKKEVQWLKDHTLFGFRFFLRSSATMNIDVRYAQLLANNVGAMRNMEAHRVIEQARLLEVVISDDLDTMRVAIAQIQAKQQMQRVEEAEKIRLKDNSKKALVSE